MLLAFGAATAADAPGRNSPPSTSRMLADIAELAGPQYNGRQTGTEDDRRGADYVAGQLRLAGLSPVMQEAPVAVARIAAPARLTILGESPRDATLGAEFLPILDSPSVDVTVPLVFVGYGLPEDYADVDVRGRAVLFLRGKPSSRKEHIGHAEKDALARERGAVAVVTMTAPVLSGYEARRGGGFEPVALYSQPPGTTPLPGAWVRTDVMEEALASSRFGKDRPLRDIQADLDALQHHSGDTGLRVALSWSASVSSGTLMNVTARLEGRDAAVKDCVVLGAHRDHFGRQAGLLFPGADDNASGTAILLEAARILAASPVRPKRAVVFVSFSGEERGLLGSRLYTAAPPYPLRDTVAMVNVDHAGIGNGRLTVGLDRISKERAARAAPPAVADRLDLFGFFPGGDHVPFKEAGVPTAAVVSSGAHPHFHRPDDAPSTLSHEQLAAAAAYVVGLVWELAEN